MTDSVKLNKSKAVGRTANLFFVEMIIVLLFFSIASAVIMKAFVTADMVSRESSRLEKISFCAQTAAENFSVTGSLSEAAEEMFGIKTEQVSQITVPMNSFCEYSPAEAEMYMKMSVSGGDYGGRLAVLNIVFTDKTGETLYEVNSGAVLSDSFEEKAVAADE